MIRSAARDGDPTEHAPRLAGGSPDVFVNGRAAWRTTVDSIQCTEAPSFLAWNGKDWAPKSFPGKDGKEAVAQGVTRVYINDQHAVGVGHVLVGKNSPNMIVAGSPDVLYGEAAFGLMTKAALSEYCKDMAKARADWAKLSTNERRLRLAAIARKQARLAGIPEPGVGLEAGSAWGTFDRARWVIDIDRGLLRDALKSDQDFCNLASTLTHELRHMEGAWQATRYIYAQRPIPRKYRYKLAGGVPPFVARKARNDPPPVNGPERVFGAAVAEDTWYFKGDQTTSDEYVNTPGGRHAKEVEAKGCCGFVSADDRVHEGPV